MGRTRDRVISIANQLADDQVAEKTPCYFEITEGRTDWTGQDGQIKHYSWCGDFVTFVLMSAGIVDGRLLNRVAINGDWQIGRNIDMLVSRGREVGVLLEGPAALAYVQSRLQPSRGGDVYVMSADGGGHVGLLSHARTPNEIVTLDGNGPFRRTGRNVRAFASNHRLVAVIPIDYWDTQAMYNVDRSAPYAGAVSTAAVEVASIIARDTGWASDLVGRMPDEFYNLGTLGVKES